VLAGMGGYGVRAQESAELEQRVGMLESRLAAIEGNTLPPPSPHITWNGAVTDLDAVLTDPALDMTLICYQGDPLAHLDLMPGIREGLAPGLVGFRCERAPNYP